MPLEISNCCGFSLKHGTIIIGVINSIFSFMVMALCAAYAENPHELIDMSDPSIVPDLTVLRGLLIGISVAAALQCVFSIMIIFGAETNRPRLLLPWLIYVPLGTLVYIVLVLVAIVEHSSGNKALFVVAHLAVATMVSLVAAYKIIAVKSFYRHLKGLNF